MGLMKKELECIEGILNQRRLDVNTPKTPRPSIIAELRLERNEFKLTSLKRRRETAWNWQKAGLDDRIREIEKRIKSIKEEIATRAATTQSFTWNEEKKKLKHYEEQYAALKGSLPKPESLTDIEAQIKSMNEDIMAALSRL